MKIARERERRRINKRLEKGDLVRLGPDTVEFGGRISARIGVRERDVVFAFDREFGNRVVRRGIEMIGDGCGNRNRDRGWGRVHLGVWGYGGVVS